MNINTISTTVTILIGTASIVVSVLAVLKARRAVRDATRALEATWVTVSTLDEQRGNKGQ